MSSRSKRTFREFGARVYQAAPTVLRSESVHPAYPKHSTVPTSHVNNVQVETNRWRRLRFRIMLHPEHDQLFGVEKNVESDGKKINSVLYSRGKVHTAILHGAYFQDLLARLRCTMLHVMIPACICRTMSSSRKGWAPTCWQKMSPSRKE